MVNSIQKFVWLIFVGLVLPAALYAQVPPASWYGVLRDAAGSPIAGAKVELHASSPVRAYSTASDPQGAFGFPNLPPGDYSVRVEWQGRAREVRGGLHIGEAAKLSDGLRLTTSSGELTLVGQAREPQARASGGAQLSSRQVSELPLNKRDFSQLLLLAAGTMTDTNGSANFTQQFAVNGQRGSTAMFAMDGVDTTDPELGGGTFTNFNVDAVQEIQSLSGVMMPEFGHGAAGFTNIKTKAGTDQLHGSVFEFVRNAAFDARNFFDRRTLADPGRIPPFIRNEFGFAIGGPVKLPGVYEGRGRTFFFGQYQGFRQILGTTQVLSVPTQAERQGEDSTAFAGDTLHVPVSSLVAPVLAAYPLPNDPQGPFGARTYATSSRVVTDTNQFSIRLDHKVSDQSRLFGRFNFNNVNGPLTNPSQSAIDPSFAITFKDHQRNAALDYTRVLSPHFSYEGSLGYIRSTPLFISPNHTQPALTFSDSLYEPFNAPAGTATGPYTNLYQLRQNFMYLRGTHSLKFGFEGRVHRDTAVFGINPNGSYIFGGGTAYAPVAIPSTSGQHDIQAGNSLPDTLTGFLTATPFSYNSTVPAPFTARGDHFNEVNDRRQCYNFFFQDAWKLMPLLTLNYGLRYEYNGFIHEPAHRISGAETVGPDGKRARFWDPGARQVMVINPQPPYERDLNGWGPRASLEWQATSHTVVRAGAAISTILPNMWLDNMLTGGFPFMVNPNFAAQSGLPVPFSNSVTTFELPTIYTPSGQVAVPDNSTNRVPPNTPVDMARFQSDLAAITPGHQPQPLSWFSMAWSFRNGYVGTYTAGFEQNIKDVVVSASYVATVGVKLAATISPNGYVGASPEFAPFSQFNDAGQVVGGYTQEYLMSTPSHSTYHSLQVSASKSSPRYGLGFQSTYTLSKSLDDTSSVVVGFGGPSGTVIQAPFENPWSPGLDKGPSTFDIAEAFTTSVIEALPFDRVNFFRPLGTKLTSGWQILNITTLNSGSPFSVYSGIQQTGMGSAGADRPDQVGRPDFSTARTVREDYFGRGTNNTSFFYIPIGIPGGTGPNQGRFGTLGRNTFRGPALHDLDLALIKDTALGHRARSEPAILEFRAEFFNCFNLVNFGLPVNILHASGFGMINRTAGTSRQIQFSLKLIY